MRWVRWVLPVSWLKVMVSLAVFKVRWASRLVVPCKDMDSSCKDLAVSLLEAGQQDVRALMGMGGMQQQQRQQMLDAQRAGLLQAQQAPLQQYQQLLPFMQFAAGQTGPSAVTTQYTPPPSPLQAGLGTGLSALGALGCLLYTSPSPRDGLLSRMPSSA